MQGIYDRMSAPGQQLPCGVLASLPNLELGKVSWLVIGEAARDALLPFNEANGSFIVTARRADATDIPVLRGAMLDTALLVVFAQQLDSTFASSGHTIAYGDKAQALIEQVLRQQ
jgi:hypothetical protein